MSVAALACALLYTSLDETVPQTSREAATEGRPKRDAQADSAEGEERELWLELLADRRWRGLSCAEVGTRFGSCAKIASVPVLAAAVLPGGATAAGKRALARLTPL